MHLVCRPNPLMCILTLDAFPQAELVAMLYVVLVLSWVGMALCASPFFSNVQAPYGTLTLFGAAAGLIHVLIMERMCVASVRSGNSSSTDRDGRSEGSGRAASPVIIEHALAPLMLYAAAAKGNAATARHLLAKVSKSVLGVKVTAWACYIAATKGHPDVASAMLELRPAAAHCALSRALGETVAHAAVGNGCVKLLAKLLRDHRVSPNVPRMQDGLTLLHIAVATKRRALVEYLLCEGADIGATDGGGLTPLHMAATSGDASIVSLLLEAGRLPWESGGGSRGGGHRMVNAKDWCEGNTPLHLAASRGHTAVCGVLLQAGAAPSPRGGVALQITPLHLACCTSYPPRHHQCG